MQMDSNFDFCTTFLANKHCCVVKDALDANGYLLKWFLSLMLHPGIDKRANS